MKKWQKFFLGLLILVYIFVLSISIWPEAITVIYCLFSKIFGSSHINQHDFLSVAQIGLLVVTVLILLIVLLIPTQKKGILLEKNKKGILSLSNEGVISFVNTRLSGHGLSNIKVNFKNTKRLNSFDITADSLYKNHVVTQLPQIKQSLISEIKELLSGIDDKKIKLNIKVHQQRSSSAHKKKATRVV
ncbi:alkaline shock response membrane anchor protein AmaP [Leuconostoc citreum]